MFTDWSQLPENILVDIFAELDAFCLLNTVSLVCRQWSTVCRDNQYLWKKFYRTKHEACISENLVPENMWKTSVVLHRIWKRPNLTEKKLVHYRSPVRSASKQTSPVTLQINRCMYSNGDTFAVCSGRRVDILKMRNCEKIGEIEILEPSELDTISCLSYHSTKMIDLRREFNLGLSTGFVVCGMTSGYLLQFGLGSPTKRRVKISSKALTSLATDNDIIVHSTFNRFASPSNILAQAAGTVDKEVIICDTQLKLIHRLMGHMKQVWCVVVYRELVISGSGDSKIKVWNKNSGKNVSTISSHEGPVYSMSVANDRLVAGSYDHTVRLFDLETFDCVLIFRGHSRAVHSVQCSCNIIASVSCDGVIRLWDVITGECIQNHDYNCHFILLDASRLISCGPDNVIRLFGAF